jgi:hypothetical protein
VSDGRVYVANFFNEPDGPSGRLLAFDTDGNQVWSSQDIRGSVGSPAVANGVVYIGSNLWEPVDNNLHAFDAAGTVKCSGEPRVCTELWGTVVDGTWLEGSPAIANGVVYAADRSLHAYALP